MISILTFARLERVPLRDGSPGRGQHLRPVLEARTLLIATQHDLSDRGFVTQALRMSFALYLAYGL